LWGALALLVGLGWMTRPAEAQALCESCELQAGLGGTYHYWGATGGVVFPLSLTWSRSRYELGLFRVTTGQMLNEPRSRSERVLAQPYWGVSLSRRWQLFEHGPAAAFVGFGLAAKTESDALSITRWDFASQVGVRLRLPGNRAVGELTLRHWSNGGIRLPNRGQDFVTVTIRLNSSLFGVVDQMPPLARHEADHSPAAGDSPHEQLPY
jgi:hypothetical protein